MTDNHDAIEWSDSFLLGFTPMDDIHAEFVDLIGRIQVADDAELPELFDALKVHLEHHFELENRWMAETNFPPRDCHIDEHAAVLKSVGEVQELLREGNTAICRDIVNELANWFPSHADHLDSALAHWMSKLRFGGKPVVLRKGLSLG